MSFDTSKEKEVAETAAEETAVEPPVEPAVETAAEQAAASDAPAQQPEAADAASTDTASVEDDDPFASFVDPTVRTKEDLAASKKKKKTVLIAAFGGAFVILAIALVLLLVVFPKKETPASDSGTEDTSITLLDKTTTSVPTAIKSAALQGENFSLELVGKDNAVLVKGYEDLPVHKTNMEALTNALTLYKAIQDIGEKENLSEFGFDKPLVSASVTFYDDSTYAFELGNLAPDQTGYYFREKDSRHLYIIPATSGDAMRQQPLSYVSTTVLEQSKTTGEDAEIVLRDMKLSGTSRKDKEFAFRLVTSEDDSAYLYHTYIITYPFKKGANTSLGADLKNFSSLTAADIAAVRPSAAELREFGLDNPSTVAEFTLAECTTVTGPTDSSGNSTAETKYSNLREHTLRLGRLADEYYYCMIDDVPVVYLVASSSIPFATLQYDEFTDNLLFLESIDNIGRMQVTTPASSSDFLLTHHPDITDNDKNLTVTAGGKTYDTMNFRYLVQNFMGVARYGSLSKSVDGLPLKLSLSYTLNGEAKPAFSAQFYEYSSSLYAAVLSNGERYTVKASIVENMIQQYQNLLNGEKVLY